MSFPQNHYTRRRDILDEMAVMVRDFLFSTVFKGKTEAEYRIAAGLSIPTYHSATPPMSEKKAAAMTFASDVPEMCEAADVDLGVTLRLPNGDLVTFFPEKNFSRNSTPKEETPTVSRVIDVLDEYGYE